VVIAIAPRLTASFDVDGVRIAPASWRDTRILLPPGLGAREYVDRVTGASHRPGPVPGPHGLSVAALLGDVPVALLRATDS
jgi:maltooligosyltrehalose synthase